MKTVEDHQLERGVTDRRPQKQNMTKTRKYNWQDPTQGHSPHNNMGTVICQQVGGPCWHQLLIRGIIFIELQEAWSGFDTQGIFLEHVLTEHWRRSLRFIPVVLLCHFVWGKTVWVWMLQGVSSTTRNGKMLVRTGVSSMIIFSSLWGWSQDFPLK